MKKLTLFFAMVSFAIFANAQSMNVSSAIQDLKKGYLNKAKSAIDAACVHESTKDDAKTWCYAGLIYSRIGGEATNPKSKFKDLDPNWCEKALNAANRCKELDKENEFSTQNNEVFRFVGNDFYSRAVTAFNDEKDYAKAMNLAEQSVKIFTNSGDKKFANDAYYLAGLSAKVTKDTNNMIKYFKILVRGKYDKEDVYNTLFNIYKEKNENEEAIKVANSFNKAYPNNFNSNLLLAKAYFLNGNVEKGREMINSALANAKDKPEYSQVVNLSANIFETNNDYEGAERLYNESLTFNPNQFDANFGMGIMIFNRGADKKNAANAVPLDDETGLNQKLEDEAKGFFRQSISYFQAALNYVDNLTDENQKQMQRKNQYECLKALKQVYAQLEMYAEGNAIKQRMSEIEKAQ